MKPLVVMGLLFLSVFFVFFNWRCILPKERKKASVMVRLVLVSPVSYLFLVQTAFELLVQVIAWDFTQNADGKKAMVSGLIFMACSLVFLVPFLKGYSKVTGKPFELCYFIYCMFAIMHMDAISLSSRTYLYFIVVIVFVLIWYFLFRKDLRELALQSDGKRIAKINAVLSLAFVVNLLMENGTVFRLFFPKDSFSYRFFTVYQLVLSIFMYLFMLALFSSIFSLDRESKAHEKARIRAKEYEREALESQSEVARALASIIDNKSGETGNHVKRVGEYARVIGREMGMEERTCETLATAAMLHDVGKLMIRKR